MSESESESEMQEIMQRIAIALSQIDPSINQGILDMARGLSKQEIINLFNQSAMDFFATAIYVTTQMKREKEFGFAGYETIFSTTLKINAQLPIDKFTLIILEHAPDIYDANETHFLRMHIPNGEIKTSNAFSIIKSDEFKKLWCVLQPSDKEKVKEHIISLTTYAHAFFYKLIFK